MHAYIHPCMHACMHTYIHVYIYIHEAMIYRPFFCSQPRGFLYYKCGARGQVSSILLALLLLWCIPWIPSIIIRLPRVVAGQLGHETCVARCELHVARRRQIWGVQKWGIALNSLFFVGDDGFHQWEGYPEIIPIFWGEFPWSIQRARFMSSSHTWFVNGWKVTAKSIISKIHG